MQFRRRYYCFISICAFFLLPSGKVDGQGFLKVNGKQIVNGTNNPVLLKGIGLGGWMLQEPYMLQLSKVAGTQTEIKSKITALIGEKKCKEFYNSYLNNMITERDID